MPIMQAAVDGMRDSSEDTTTAVCEALYAVNPEGVCSFVKFMTALSPTTKSRTD